MNSDGMSVEYFNLLLLAFLDSDTCARTQAIYHLRRGTSRVNGTLWYLFQYILFDSYLNIYVMRVTSCNSG